MYGLKAWPHSELGDHLFGWLRNLFWLWTYEMEGNYTITNTCYDRKTVFSKSDLQEEPASSEHGFAFLSQNPKGFLPKDIHSSSKTTSHSCAGHYSGISIFTATTQKYLHI